MPPTRPKTKTGTRRLSEVARHLVAPADIVSTGWPAVRKTCVDKLGIDFDDWQDSAGRVILAKRADGNLAAMVDGVGMSLPRQVGKTYLIGATVFALCVNTPGLLVIWSAHHARTHGETFLAMQGFASRSRVKAHVRQVFMGSGDEEIRFHNGSRILFGARERGFGRGIPGVDVLIFDEAQILSDRALSNMLATMNRSRFGLALYVGTPPKPDDMSEVFTRMREDAIAGRLSDGAWIELGADRGSSPDDRKQWAKANPSYPRWTPAESMLRLKRKLTPADFDREGRGIWDEAKKADSKIDLAQWAKLLDPQAKLDGDVALSVEVSSDGRWSTIGVCGESAGRLLVLDKADRGLGWVVDEVVRMVEKHSPRVVALDPAGKAGTLIADLSAAGVEVKAYTAREMQQACGWFQQAVADSRLAHLGQPELDTSVRTAITRELRDGAEVWDRREGGPDIAPLVAVSVAAHAYATSDEGPSVYESREMVTL